MSKRAMREFVKQEETVAAAKSKERKAAKKAKRQARFANYLREKAENLEMNGNPRAAQNFREYWGGHWGVKFPGHPEVKQSAGRRGRAE